MLAPNVRVVVQYVEALEHGVCVQVLASPVSDQLGQPLFSLGIPRRTICLVVKPLNLSKDDFHPKVAHSLLHVIRHGGSVLIEKKKGLADTAGPYKEKMRGPEPSEPRVSRDRRGGSGLMVSAYTS